MALFAISAKNRRSRAVNDMLIYLCRGRRSTLSGITKFVTEFDVVCRRAAYNLLEHQPPVRNL